MADISQEINDFKNAIYGEEVRGSMISLAQKLNTEVEENTTNVNQAVSTANSASSAANQAVQDANTTLKAANQAVKNAAGSASAAAGSASAAAGSAEDAAESAAAASGSASAAAQSAANAAEVAEGLGGFTGAASSVTAQDVEGLLGSPGAQSNVQALIDAIADQVLNRLVKKSQIVNNLLATQAGNVLDATQGKALKDLIDQLNSDFGRVPSGNFDLNNPPAYNVFVAAAPSTNRPDIGGNSVMCFQQFTDNENYNALLCFGFGSDKIAIKRKNNSSEWTAWKYITLSET